MEHLFVFYKHEAKVVINMQHHLFAALGSQKRRSTKLSQRCCRTLDLYNAY